MKHETNCMIHGDHQTAVGYNDECEQCLIEDKNAQLQDMYDRQEAGY